LPPIPGVDKQGVYTIQKSMSAMNALREKVHAAKNVVIIGGGFIGAEFADELSQASDVETHVIEIMPKLINDNYYSPSTTIKIPVSFTS